MRWEGKGMRNAWADVKCIHTSENLKLSHFGDWA